MSEATAAAKHELSCEEAVAEFLRLLHGDGTPVPPVLPRNLIRALLGDWSWSGARETAVRALWGTDRFLDSAPLPEAEHDVPL